MDKKGSFEMTPDRGEWKKIHIVPTPHSLGQGQEEENEEM